MKEIEIYEYIEKVKPLNHDPDEEKEWQEHYQWVVDNSEIFSEQYVWWCLHQLKVDHRYRK